MSKKNKWRKITPAVTEPRAAASGAVAEQTPTSAREALVAPTSSNGPISPAQLAANRANALLSTGPRTEAGIAKSSKNAVKSALTGRTVLLPTDDVEEYRAFLESFQNDLKPVGPMESELVQIIVDCHWRLRRIQELEYALYAHGERQFAEMFSDEPQENRRSMIVLQTHLTYQKELRNLHIQEARLDRKRAKALDELAQLQAERNDANASQSEPDSDAAPFASEKEFFAALDAGYVPPRLAAQLAKQQPLPENGFVFSNDSLADRL